MKSANGLTDEQRAVVETPSDARILVTAGPGTGKTHTLVARLVHLVDCEDVPPGRVLALSFSRAAVGELRRRLKATGEDAGRIAPITFDSFATRLLADVDPDGAWTNESYDGRIAAAIRTLPEASDLLDGFDHICVDELQDLVGVRMRFVRALLEQTDIGFTLLGDPAQGIYDFSLADGETADRDGAPALYSRLRERYADDLVDKSLTVNHRAVSEIAKQGACLGSLVVDDPEKALKSLLELLDGADRVGTLTLLRYAETDIRTAVLCRNNGEALWVSKTLIEAGVDHVLQRGATNRSIAPWVAQVITAKGGGALSRERFADIVDEQGLDVDDFHIAWSAMRRIARHDGGVDLDRLVFRMREGNVPDELHAVRSAPIVVSTVHRAKGLEFDSVVVLDDGWRNDPSCIDEAARTLFVAVSRSIDGLRTCDLPKMTGRLRIERDRWVHAGWKHWQRWGVEVEPSDVDVTSPPGGLNVGDAAEIQQRLIHDVRPGDPVELSRLHEMAGLKGALYRVDHTSGPIGVTTKSFGFLLGHLTSKPPSTIGDLTIDAVRSVAGDPLETNQLGLGPGGAWLAPSLVGMSRFTWKRD